MKIERQLEEMKLSAPRVQTHALMQEKRRLSCMKWVDRHSLQIGKVLISLT